MKIKSLILALCLSPLNSFAAPSDVKTEKESLGYVSSSIKWCGENKGKCAGVVVSVLALTTAGIGYGYSKFTEHQNVQARNTAQEKLMSDFNDTVILTARCGAKYCPTYKPHTILLNGERTKDKYIPGFELKPGAADMLMHPSHFEKEELAKYKNYLDNLPELKTLYEITQHSNKVRKLNKFKDF